MQDSAFGFMHPSVSLVGFEVCFGGCFAAFEFYGGCLQHLVLEEVDGLRACGIDRGCSDARADLNRHDLNVVKLWHVFAQLVCGLTRRNIPAISSSMLMPNALPPSG